MATRRIRIGTMLTPVSRRRPWKLAAETSTLDRLSKGRVILSVGLGALETGFANFGEVTKRKARVELLDEGLKVIARAWRGKPFEFKGRHYQIKPTEFFFAPPPIQKPHIPVWVVGVLHREKSMRRVARWDGWLPNKINSSGKHERVTPDDIRAGEAEIAQLRNGLSRFDIIVEGSTDGKNHRSARSLTKE